MASHRSPIRTAGVPARLWHSVTPLLATGSQALPALPGNEGRDGYRSCISGRCSGRDVRGPGERKRLLIHSSFHRANRAVPGVPFEHAKFFLKELDKRPTLAHPIGIMKSTVKTIVPFTEQVRLCIECIAENGAAGLSGLFDLTATRLVRFSVTITRNQHDAEDAVQAALVRVVSNIRLVRAADAPWSYLLRMVRNESLVILRKKKRWPLVSSLADLLTRRTVDELELEETHRAVWSALRSLPTEQSEVVVLKIWEEMTFAEIAEVLELPPATAASRYRYALSKLAGHLRSLENEVRRG